MDILQMGKIGFKFWEISIIMKYSQDKKYTFSEKELKYVYSEYKNYLGSDLIEWLDIHYAMNKFDFESSKQYRLFSKLVEVYDMKEEDAVELAKMEHRFSFSNLNIDDHINIYYRYKRENRDISDVYNEYYYEWKKNERKRFEDIDDELD